MSGKGKGSGLGKKKPIGEKKETRSAKAGLTFPVGRIERHLKNGRYAKRIGAGAPIYLAAVLEYLTAEILELAGNQAKEMKKGRIAPRHIQLAARNDDELNIYLSDVVIVSGGVLPASQEELQKDIKKGG
eukprot:GHVH01006252.1.p1 GENE.GHVH01006252.1~~GHVH01006252.1.p1  ORF type:complete len:149 (-),score=19.56 GHVH01006252.1:145-534(-)